MGGTNPMTHREDAYSSQIQFRWSPNAFKGFIVSLAVFLLMLVITKCTKIEAPIPYSQPGYTTVDLVFGAGNSTGPSGGNLSTEGRAQKGKEGNPLDDASSSSTSKLHKTISDPTQSSRQRIVDDAGGKNNAKANSTGEGNVGAKDGTDDGTGLGWAGTGSGKGLGYGLEWGGGGNRIVLHKELPRFPDGALNTQVKLRFRVRPDGTVSWVMPVRRGGNPAVDQAAIQALYRWRFNPLGTDVEMEGTISFVFKNA